MSVTGAVINAILLAITDFMSIRVSMGVDTGSIARNSGGGRNQPKFHRRDNGNERKELLEEFFIMKRENPSGFVIPGCRLGNFFPLPGLEEGFLFLFSGNRSLRPDFWEEGF